MSVVQDNNSAKAYRLLASDGCSEATILPAYGGVVASLRLPGTSGVRECLYQQPSFNRWPRDDLAGGMPFIFPAFGRLECAGERGVYRYRGQAYRLPIHGFAWQCAWSVLTSTEQQLSLQLTDTLKTRAQYPFSFEVQLHYHLEPGLLRCEQRYRNCGVQPMPYTAGFHPYFATPPAGQGKERVLIEYQAQRQFIYNSSFTALVGEVPALSMPRVIEDVALRDALSQLRPSTPVVLRYPTGDALQLNAEGLEDSAMFAYLQLYTVPDQPFFCAEPLTSPPNSLNTGTALRWLAPGAEARGRFTLSMHKIHDT